METKKYIHVSFDVVDHFKPRVPANRIPGEDEKIPRICVSDRLLSCINAMPAGPETLQIMQQLGLPLVIHAYYMHADKIWDTDRVMRYVPDAWSYRECWLLSEPSRIYRVDYRVEDPQLLQPETGPLVLLKARFRRCVFTDNADELCQFFHVKNSETFMRLVRSNGYTSVMCNMRDEFFAKKNSMIEKKKKNGKEVE